MKVPIHILVITNSIDPIKKLLKGLIDNYLVYYNKELSITKIEPILTEKAINLVLIDYDTIENIPNQLDVLTKQNLAIPFIVVGQLITIKELAILLKVGAKAGLSTTNLELLPILIEREFESAEQLKQLKASKQALLEKNITLNDLFDNNTDAILIHDYQEIKQVNKAFLKQLGYENKHELLGENALETIVYSEDIPITTLSETQRKSETKLIIPQVRLLKKNGTILLSDLQILSLFINGVWQAKIILKPITDSESVQVYLAGEKQSSLLIKHVEQVPGIIYQFQLFEDYSFCFPFVNNRVYDLYGIRAEELMKDGSMFLKYMHESDINPFFESVELSRATLEEWRMDYRIQLPGQEIRWMRGNSSPVRMPDGSTLWYGYVTDITREKNASAALEDSEEQIRTMFTYAPDAILLMDMEGRITKWNPKATAIFGWTDEEALGQKLYKLIGPERNYQRYQSNVDFYKKEKKGVILNQALEVRAVHKNGEEFSITMALSEMTIRNEKFFICFMNDITKRKNAEDRLKQSLREKEVLLKEIHHRVKNNMQVITSLLSLQSSFLDDEEIKDIFRNSQYRINSMGMVHEMLYQSEDLSKINYGNYLGRLIWGLIEAMKGSRNTIDLKLDVPDITLNVDTAIPLGLIINELVTNSLKYGFPNGRKGTIFVHLASLEYPNLKLEIGDDGIGMLSDAKPRTSQSLGLMLVNRLAVQLKGNIQYLKNKKGTHYVLSFQEIYQFNP